MPLTALSLDRVDYDRLVEEARRAIIARSGGEWTLHAPVDPGMTLIELFAWLLDQRAYFLDQVPDALLRALATLLGEEVRPARPAGVALCFDGGASPREISRRTPLRVDRPDARAWFTTRERVIAVPVEAISVLTADGDRSEDLRARREVALLPAHGGPAEAVITLHCKAPLPAASSGAPLALLFEVESAGVEPEWSPDATAVPAPAELSWSYRRAGGALAQFSRVVDGTGGLRRAGVVRLDLPPDWTPSTDSAGRPTYELRVSTVRASFSAPPHVWAIRANAALALHRRWTERAAEPAAWLPLPGRQIELDADVGPVLEERVWLRVRERDGRWRRWRPVADVAAHGPADRVFVVDREKGLLRFADGLTGRIPYRARAEATIELRFEAGGGDAGNVGPSRWVGDDESIEAESLSSARGGRESETPEGARPRIAAALRRRTRAVTALDHARIALETPGVAIARAHAAVGFDSRHRCIVRPGATTVFVVPRVPLRDEAQVGDGSAVAAPIADPGLLAAVRARFCEMRLVGSAVFVAAARYRQVSIELGIEGDPYDPAALRRRVAAALRVYLDPVLGGAEKTGWPFGAPLRPTAILRVAQAAAGDDGVVVGVSVGLGDAAPAPACDDVEIAAHELLSVRGIDVAVRAAQGAP